MANKQTKKQPKQETKKEAVETAEVSFGPYTATSGSLQDVEFPTDIYGFTRELRQTLVSMAGRINGHADKLDLVERTIAVGLGYMLARFKEETAANE